MTFFHGIRTTESPTSIVAPIKTGSVPIIFGTSEINLVPVEDRAINTPVVCYSQKDVASYLGVGNNIKDFNITQASDVFFKLFAVAPVIFVNVLDPKKHKKEVTGTEVDRTTLEIKEQGILHETFELKAIDIKIEANKYKLAFTDEGYTQIVLLEEVTGALTADYSVIDPSKVEVDDYIGGEDVEGVKTGLEVINDCYSLTGIFPSMGLVPGVFDNEVISILETKMANQNGLIKGLSFIDIPTTTIKKYQDVSAYKKDNNLISNQQYICWPMVKLGESKYYMSLQAAALKAKVDAENGTPHESPSNKALKMDGLCLHDGTKINMGLDVANYLNSQGVATAINFNGWVLWGNYTGAYPGTTDVKDTFLCVRDMFNTEQKSFILTYVNKVDKPGNRNQIDSIVESQNIKYNGLTSAGILYGGKVEFREEDNPVTDLIGGTFKFKLFLSPTIPMQEIVEDFEFDPESIKTIFN
ncbi:MAG: phage tail sheath family protein [Cetobacterium sp.]|uniref:phage tail sheath family protein n=1 Tax=Cetobacterium sp. TaxID=2071632 RepID=UPI003F2B0009